MGHPAVRKTQDDATGRGIPPKPKDGLNGASGSGGGVRGLSKIVVEGTGVPIIRIAKGVGVLRQIRRN